MHEILVQHVCVPELVRSSWDMLGHSELAERKHCAVSARMVLLVVTCMFMPDACVA